MQLHTTGLGGAGGAQPIVGSLGARPYRVRCAAEAPPALSAGTLACIDYGPPQPGEPDPRRVHVSLDLLDGPGAELWESRDSVRYGWDHGIGFAENGRVLFGQMRIPEGELAHTDKAVFHAYAIIDGFLRRHGYPAWLRVWNYLAHINQGEGDDERYRQFSLGRYKALALKPGFERELPAATAIGAYDGGLLIYFLAGREPGLQVENPRQVSAFRYPRQYGPRSPSFSRAVLLPWADTPELLVSGTASVVGHQTLHAGQPERQMAETLANLEAVVEQASTMGHPGSKTAWQVQGLKLYVRDRALAAPAASAVRAALPQAQIVSLHGDVCRSDLSLEVEAVFMAAGSSAA